MMNFQFNDISYPITKLDPIKNILLEFIDMNGVVFKATLNFIELNNDIDIEYIILHIETDTVIMNRDSEKMNYFSSDLTLEEWIRHIKKV